MIVPDRCHGEKSIERGRLLQVGSLIPIFYEVIKRLDAIMNLHIFTHIRIDLHEFTLAWFYMT